MSTRKQGMMIISGVYKISHVEPACTCSGCGKNIDKNDNYCRFCGMKITGVKYVNIKGDPC